MMGNKELQALKDWLDSEEGKESIKKFHEKIALADSVKDKVITRIHNYLSTLTDDELETLCIKFSDWEDMQVDKLYDRGIDGNSLLFTRLTQMAEKFGEELPEQNEMFYGHGSKYRGYDFKTYYGQGSFTSLTKDDNRYV